MKIERLCRTVAVIQSDIGFLIKRGLKGEIMSDLHEFPYFEIEPNAFSPQAAQEMVSDNLKLCVEQITVLEKVDQGFTRYQVRLFPILFVCRNPRQIPGMQWLSHEKLMNLAFSSGHRKIFQQLDDWLLPV